MRPGRSTRAASPHRLAAERVATVLRDARVRAGLGQQEVSRRASVSLSTLSKIENCVVIEPGFFTMLALCRALGIPATQLIKVVQIDGSVHGDGALQQQTDRSD